MTWKRLTAALAAAVGISSAPQARAADVQQTWLQYWDTPAYAEEFREVELDPAGKAWVAGGPGLFEFASSGELLWRDPAPHRGLAISAAGDIYAVRSTDAGDEVVMIGAAGGGWVAPVAPSVVDGWPVRADALRVGPSGEVVVAGAAWVGVPGTSLAIERLQVTRYAPDGTVSWSVLEEDPNAMYTAGLAVDGAGNVMVAACGGALGYTVVKHGPDGAPLWSATVPGFYNGPGDQLVADALGTVYLQAWDGIHSFSPDGAPLAFAPLAVDYSPHLRLAPTGDVVSGFTRWGEGGFVAKLGPDLSVRWVTALGVGRQVEDIACDGRGDVFVAGSDWNGTPHVMTWAVESKSGAIGFELLNPDVGYGYGSGIAAAPSGHTFYTAAYTWYFRDAYYGGVLLRFDAQGR